MMKIVRQPEGTGLCVVACLAMLTNSGLNQVLSKVHLRVDARLCPRPYLPMRGAIRFLLDNELIYGGAITFGTPHSTSSDDLSVDGLLLTTPNNALLSVQSETDPKLLHMVVWDWQQKMVLDPQHDDPQPLSRYVIVDWANVIPMDEV